MSVEEMMLGQGGEQFCRIVRGEGMGVRMVMNQSCVRVEGWSQISRIRMDWVRSQVRGYDLGDYSVGDHLATAARTATATMVRRIVPRVQCCG